MEEVHTKFLQFGCPKEMIMSIMSMENETKLLIVLLLWGRWDARNKANSCEMV